MSFDIYQPCPGGQDKKIKFCCKDLFSDLEKISRLIEADQRQAALDHINRALVRHPDRACLHAHKLQLTLGDRDREKVVGAIDAFLKVAPMNPTALSAQAIRYAAEWDAGTADGTSNESLRKSVTTLQRALSLRGKYVSLMLLTATSIVGRRLLSEGHVLAAAAHFHLAGLFASSLDRRADDLIEFLGDPSVSLLAKDWSGLPDPPADANWKADYDVAREKAVHGAWSDAASLIEALAKKTLGEPLPRKALGLLRCFLGESQKAVDLLRRYAAMEGITADEAVRVEALAQLVDTASRPVIKSLEVRWELSDADQTKERLLAHPQAVSLGTDLSHLTDDDGPPPAAGFWIVDRAPPGEEIELTFDNVPRALATAYLFGRQTDRPAQLVIIVDDCDLDRLHAIIAEVLDASDLENYTTETIEEYPATTALVDESLAFPRSTPTPVRKRIEAEGNRITLRERWADLPAEIFGGKTPREAARDDSLKVRVQAALLVLESQQLRGLRHADYQTLREELGLDKDEPIDCAPGTVQEVRIAALVRVDASKLNDGDLLNGFQFAAASEAIEAARNFGEELLRRQVETAEVRANVNMVLCRLSTDSEDSLAYLHEAQRYLKELGQSPAPLLIHELTLRAVRHESDEFNEVYERIVKRHINEPGIREKLLEVMVRLGLLQPDGTPTRTVAEPATSSAAAAPEAARIWTPDDTPDAPSGEQVESKSKLWVPGMD